METNVIQYYCIDTVWLWFLGLYGLYYNVANYAMSILY